MKRMKITALNPVGHSVQEGPAQAASLSTLRGKTVGFFGNNKPNVDAVLERLAAELSSSAGIKALHFAKGIPSLQAPEELLAEIAASCDAAVLGVGD
jgi:hypothetical protein